MSGIVFGCIVPHPPIVLPEIGGDRSAEVTQTQRAMADVAQRLKNASPDVIVLISPHGESKTDTMGVVAAPMTIGSFLPWGIKGLDFSFKNDLDFVAVLKEEAGKLNVPLKALGERGYNLDHGTMVPMYFFRKAVTDTPLVLLTFSWLPYKQHYVFGQAIRNAAIASGKRVAVVASGDMSHKLIPEAPAGFHPKGKEFDRRIVAAVGAHDVHAILSMDTGLIEQAGECGYRSIVILMGALESLKVKPEVLSYEGPFGVGYLVASYSIEDDTAVKKKSGENTAVTGHSIVQLARSSVESFVRTGALATAPELLTEEMKWQAGVFVSIKDRHGNLRGCIGTFEPCQANVAEEIIANAISSATRDPRFFPVKEHELPNLVYSVDVLSKPVPISSIEDHDPKRFGVIAQKGFRRGLLLPDLEGIDTPDEQLRIAKMKAGIPESDQVELFRFEVIRYTE